jgi:hypothetical protein
MAATVQEIVALALKKAGGIRALERTGVAKAPSISKWKSGESAPTADNLLTLIAYLGGDIRRALPDGWDPYTEANKDYVAKNKRLEFELADAKKRIDALEATLKRIAKLATGAPVVDIAPARKVADGKTDT